MKTHYDNSKTQKLATLLVALALTSFPLVASAQSGEPDIDQDRLSQQQQPKPMTPKKPVPARRETVQTKKVPARPVRPIPVQKTGQPIQTKMPPIRVNKSTRSQRTFTRTNNGRRYDNGQTLRQGVQVTQNWQRQFFSSGHSFYPNYVQQYDVRSDYISPYGFFYGVSYPYISRASGYNRQPRDRYIEVPLYSGGSTSGYGEDRQTNYFYDSRIDQQEPGLMNAIDELRETFQGGNIEALVALVDPGTDIAIYLQGQYQYSMNPNDFLDLTRDALASTRTTRYDLTDLHRKSELAYMVSGRQDYRDRTGRIRTVYVSYGLEAINGAWTLTQFETAPDRVQPWR